MVKHGIVSKWQRELPLNNLVVENEEPPISDASDAPMGKNHIRPDQVNEEAMDIPDVTRKMDTDIVICEDLKIFLKRK